MGTPDEVFRRRLQELDEAGEDRYHDSPYWSTRDAYADSVRAVTPGGGVQEGGPGGFFSGLLDEATKPRDRKKNRQVYPYNPMYPSMSDLSNTLHGRQFVESAVVRPMSGALGVAELFGSEGAGELRDQTESTFLTQEETESMPWLSRTIAQAAGSSVLPLLTGGAGLAATGGRMIGAGVGAAIGAFPGSADEMQRTLEEAGVEGDQLKWGTVTGGAMIAALEGIVPAGVAKIGMRGIERKIGEGVVRAVVRTMGKESLEEAGTEMIQQQIPAIARAIMTDHPYFTMEQLVQTLEAGAAGAVGGAFLAGGGAIVGGTVEQEQAISAERMSQAKADVRQRTAPQEAMDAAVRPADATAEIALPDGQERPVVSPEELAGMKPAEEQEDAFEPAGMEIEEEGEETPTTPGMAGLTSPAAEQELADVTAAVDPELGDMSLQGLLQAEMDNRNNPAMYERVQNEIERRDAQTDTHQAEFERGEIDQAELTRRENEALGAPVSPVGAQATEATPGAPIAPTVETAPVETEDLDAAPVYDRDEVVAAPTVKMTELQGQAFDRAEQHKDGVWELRGMNRAQIKALEKKGLLDERRQLTAEGVALYRQRRGDDTPVTRGEFMPTEIEEQAAASLPGDFPDTARPAWDFYYGRLRDEENDHDRSVTAATAELLELAEQYIEDSELDPNGTVGELSALVSKENPDLTMGEAERVGWGIYTISNKLYYDQQGELDKGPVTDDQIEAAAPQAEVVEGLQDAVSVQQGEAFVTDEKPIESADVGESIVNDDGSFTEVVTANDKSYKARYALVGAENAPSSHNPITFQKDPNYKGRAQDQERTYHTDTAAQEHVATRAQRLNPKRLLDHTLSPIEGPAIILADGNRLSGNGRGMMLRRAAEMHPEKYQAYLDALVDDAEAFGLTGENMRSSIESLVAQGLTPELVRVIDTGRMGSRLPSAAELVSQFNDDPRKSMDAVAEAGTRARRLRNSSAVATLTERIETDETVRSYLGTARSRPFIEAMREDGVISQEEMAKYLDEVTGLLNTEGKTLVENMLLSLAVGDPETISRALPGSLQKIEKAVPAIIQLENHGQGWEQIQTILRDALNAQAMAQSHSMEISDLNKQQELFDEGAVTYSEEALAMAEFIVENGPRRVAAAFRAVADDGIGSANLDAFQERATTLEESVQTHMGGELGTLHEDSEAVAFDPQTRTGKQIPMFDKATMGQEEGAAADTQEDLENDPDQAYLFPNDPEIQQELGLMESYGSRDIVDAALEYVNTHGIRVFPNVAERVAIIDAGMAGARNKLDWKPGWESRPSQGLGYQARLIGMPIRDTAHLARVIRFTRSPLVENLSIMAIENGRVAYHSIVTSGMLDRVNPGRAVENALTKIAQMGINGEIYVAHNHPSGDPTPSLQDRKMTGVMKEIFKGQKNLSFGGHIILDHDTATFISGRWSGTRTIKTLSPAWRGARERIVPTSEVDWTAHKDTRVNDHPLILSSLMAQANDPNRIDVVFLDAHTGVLSIEPINGWQSKLEFLQDDITDAMGRIGANTHIIVVPNPAAAQALKESGYPFEIIADFSGPMSAEDGGVMILSKTDSMEELAETDYLSKLEPLVADPKEGPRQLTDIQRQGALIMWQKDTMLREEVESVESVGGESIVSQWPEIEERLQDAKRSGVDKPSWRRIFTGPAESLDNARRAFRRHYPNLDPKNPIHAVLADQLRRFESSYDVARVKAKLMIWQWSDGLTEEQNDHVSRLLVLPDIIRQLEDGMAQPGSEAAFGYGLETAQKDLARLRRIAQTDPKVLAVMRERETARKKMVRDLVVANKLPERVLEDPRYYHRQVLEHHYAMKAHEKSVQSRAGGFDLHTRREGFQRGRTDNALDFNTEWRVAEVEWLTQAMFALEHFRTQEKAQGLFDIGDALERQANDWNKAETVRRITEERKANQPLMSPGQRFPHPFAPMQKSIAIASKNIAELALKGELDGGVEFQGLVGRLEDEYREWKQMPRPERLDNPFRFNHPQWHVFLRYLLDENKNGAAAAASTFKAIGDRNRLIKTTLGKDFKTFRSLIPEGYVLWQPEQGNMIFPGTTVAEQVLDEMYRTEVLPDRGKFKEARILGGPKETWVVPEGVAKTLNQVRQPVDRGPFRKSIVAWKQWILLSPGRVLKYNTNNMSGDLDIAVAYSPRMVKEQFVGAARDLWVFYYGEPSDELVTEMTRHLENAVVQSGFSATEVPGLDSEQTLRPITAIANWVEGSHIPLYAMRSYWRMIRKSTNYREGILRLASVRHFEKLLANGDRPLGVSKKYEMDALYADESVTDEQIAAKLARELIGDYGNISAAGEYLRDRHFPFWSWMEINAPRYTRLMLNARYKQTAGELRETEDGRDVRGDQVIQIGKQAARGMATAAPRAAVAAGAAYGRAFVASNLLFIMMNMFNKLRFPEEWEELSESRRQQHLILGRNNDGSVKSIRMEGALVDALRWFDLHDFVNDYTEWKRGNKSVGDVASEAARGPFERLWQSWNPYAKTALETATGTGTYPQLFEEGAEWRFAGRPIRDRREHAARLFDMQRFVQWVTHKPVPSLGPVEHLFSAVLTYRTDPGEAAYWLTRRNGARFMREERNRESSGGRPTERSNALYNWKKATKWGDDDAAEYWLDQYAELGGTDKGLAQSVKMAAPGAIVPQKDQEEWMEWMDPADLATLDRAYDWYERVYAPSE